MQPAVDEAVARLLALKSDLGDKQKLLEGGDTFTGDAPAAAAPVEGGQVITPWDVTGGTDGK